MQPVSPANPLDRQTLFEQLAATIEEQILAGEFNAGDRLPSESGLATQYGVSRPVVREALARLRERHLIETLNGNGTFVRHPEPGDLTAVLRRHLRLASPGVQGVVNMYEARIAVESMTAQLAAMRASDDELAEIHTQLQRMRECQTTEANWTASDLEFHKAMAQAAHNPFLVTLLRPLMELIEDSIRVGYRDPEAVTRGLEGHERIWAALQARDGEAAAAAVRDHLLYSQARLIEMLQAAQPDGPGS